MVERGERWVLAVASGGVANAAGTSGLVPPTVQHSVANHSLRDVEQLAVKGSQVESNRLMN